MNEDREIEDHQVAEREGAPELAEALEDQPRVPAARHGAEARGHLLADVENRREQHQHPQQARAVALTCLREHRHRAGVVVGRHHDQSGPQNREQRREPPATCHTRRRVERLDRSEGPSDVADVSAIERAAPIRGGGEGRRARAHREPTGV